jgi:hypothetical protein
MVTRASACRSVGDYKRKTKNDTNDMRRGAFNKFAIGLDVASEYCEPLVVAVAPRRDEYDFYRYADGTIDAPLPSTCIKLGLARANMQFGLRHTLLPLPSASHVFKGH